jgi:fimbrial isopeptide formation D2 family protein
VVVRDISLPEGFTVDPNSLAATGLATQELSFEQAAGGFLFKADMIGMKETAVITFDAIPGKAHNGKIIENTASVTAFAMAKQKQASVSVYINSPKLDLAKESHKQEYKVGDVIPYTLTLSQRNSGTFMRSVLITDNITQSGVSLLPGSIQVMDSDGKLMTHLCDITVTGNAFQILTHRDMGDQDKRIPPKEAGISPYDGLKPENRITVTYDVSVKDQALSGFTVDNIALSPATANTDGDLIREDPDIPSGGGRAEKKTPVVGAKLKIEKSSDKEIYQTGDTAKYTLKVSQLREDYVARNVVISDALYTSLASILPGSIKVTLNRQDITSSCAIKSSAGAFEIATGKDLAWADSLTVTYRVKFDPSAKGEIIRNIAITHADNAEQSEDDNTVGVEPGKAALKIIKESEKKEYQVGDSAKYHLTVTCISSAPAINVIIRDKLDTTGASISPGSIHVSMGGIDITSACAMEVTKQAFTIQTGRALKEGERILVTYDVLIEDASLIGKDVKNIAVAVSSNAEEEKDDHLITIVPGSERPEQSTLSAIHYSGDSSAQKQAGKQPRTGDGFDPLMLIVMLASAGIIGFLVYRRSVMRKKT